MKYLILTLVVSGGLIINGFAQQVQPDSLYNAIQQKYEVKLEKVDKDNREERDSVLALRADEFAGLYDQFPESEVAQKALVSSFMTWLNVKQYDKQALYIEKVSPESDIWQKLASWYSYGLMNQGKDPEVYIHFLEETLETGVRNQNSLSLIHSELGNMKSMVNKNEEAAIGHYEKVVELNADSLEVVQAKRDLYDLKSLNEGQEIPDFTATGLNGETINLKELKGKYVLIEFWATWCAPCIPEVPYLKKAYEQYGGREDFVMIGISLDTDRQKLIDFIKDKEIKWPQILDEGGETKWTGKLGNLFAVGNGIPKSFLVDKEGIIIATDLRKEKLSEELSRYLN